MSSEDGGGGDRRSDEMTTISSVTVAADSSGSNNNDSDNPPTLEGNFINTNNSIRVDAFDDEFIFFERAHIATCLQQSTVASSCAVVHKEVLIKMNDTEKSRNGAEEVLDRVCQILGDGNVCAYIRYDGSIANDTKQLHLNRRQHLAMERQQQKISRQCYTTSVVECRMPSNNTQAAAVENDGNKFYYILDKRNSATSMLSSINNQQMDQLARLSGMYLTDNILGGLGGRTGRTVDADVTPTTSTVAPTATTVTPTSSWYYPTATTLFHILKSGASRVMYGALSIMEGAEASDHYFDSIDGDDDVGGGYNHHEESSYDESSSLQVRKLLTKDVASGTIASSIDGIIGHDDENDDTATLSGRRRTKRQHYTTLALPPVGCDDMLISITVVADTCRHLLTFAQRLVSSRCGIGGVSTDYVDVARVADECNDEFSAFFVPMPDGDGIARILMYRDGWDTCSFGTFCRKAGKYFASRNRYMAASTPVPAASHVSTATMTERQTLAQYGKILSDVTREEVDLLATTLCKSNFALVEKDIIILFPGGVPADYYHQGATTAALSSISSSDFALFQIYVTKMSIQNKIVRLVRDANVAKNNAIKARRDNKVSTELALVHMRRRKAALAELERCSSLLSNLDASELRLERARDDVRLVQSYTYLRTALQDVRKTRDEVLIGNNSKYEDVEELMLDIREEMDEMNETNRRMNQILTIEQYDDIDDEELNEEFRRLEFECERDQVLSGPEKNKDETSVTNMHPLLPPTMGPTNEEPASSETLPLPA